MKNKVTIQSLAGELFDALETRTRNNGDEFTTLKDDAPAWMQPVVHATHGDKLPDDTVYQFIQDCAAAIHDRGGEEDEENAEEAIREMEPDPYTAGLTKWLAARVDHVYYLTEVLEEYGDIKDGFQLLAMAQKQQIEEVGFALIAALKSEMESR